MQVSISPYPAAPPARRSTGQPEDLDVLMFATPLFWNRNNRYTGARVAGIKVDSGKFRTRVIAVRHLTLRISYLFVFRSARCARS
jgi:hypothetical protein